MSCIRSILRYHAKRKSLFRFRDTGLSLWDALPPRCRAICESIADHWTLSPCMSLADSNDQLVDEFLKYINNTMSRNMTMLKVREPDFVEPFRALSSRHCCYFLHYAASKPRIILFFFRFTNAFALFYSLEINIIVLLQIVSILSILNSPHPLQHIVCLGIVLLDLLSIEWKPLVVFFFVI